MDENQRILSALLILSGISITILSFLLDVSVSTGVSGEKIANLDLIAIRQMVCMVGCTMFLGGIVMLAFWLQNTKRVRPIDKENDLNSTGW